jgi:Spy/CpxP family protein refolding chaperone
MALRRLAFTLFAVLLAGGVYADEAASKAKEHCILNAIAKKLGLSDQQRDQFRKIHDEFEAKAQPIQNELWKLRHEQHQAMKQVLTEQQRAELPNVIKMEMGNKLREIGDKLALTDDQRKQAEQLFNEYCTKFQDLDKEQGANVQGQFRALKHAEFEAFCGLLTDEQRVKLPGVLKEEMALWRSEDAQAKMRNEIAEKLNLTADQREKIEKICTEAGPKIEKQKTDLRQNWKDAHAAVAKVLTEEQRTKFLELTKEGGNKAE